MSAFHNSKPAKPAGVLAAFACALLAGTPAARAADTTFERLVNPEPQNWLTVHHDYSAQRFSPLDAINRTNAKNLKLVFAIGLGGTSNNESLEATPLVEDGFMYMVDSWGIVSKIDVRSGTWGAIVWQMNRDGAAGCGFT
jgi:alcohol dehydrogenase (cytochrome c)